MPTSLRLRGRSSRTLAELESSVRSRRDLLAPRVEPFADEEGRRGIAVRVLAAAEPIRIVDLGGGHLAAEAITGTAGPGYHQHACALLASLDVRWTDVEDESDYWGARDRAALENATLLGLRTLAMELLSLHERGFAGLQLSLPEGVTFEHDLVVATPMGPRDRAWLERVARTPRAGIDVLPWWDDGQTAAVARGAAIAAMWIDVRWRPPVSEAERDEKLRVVQLLERGHALAPDDPWPWREWSELCEQLGDTTLPATRAHLRAASAPATPPIGYRRRSLRVALSGGWSLRVPGALADEWDDRGTWHGWDGHRAIWFTSLEAQDAAGTQATLDGLPELPGDGDLLSFERGDLRAIARFEASEDEGRVLLAMSAQAALGAHAAIGTFTFERDADRDWALETWGSLAHLDEPR